MGYFLFQLKEALKGDLSPCSHKDNNISMNFAQIKKKIHGNINIMFS